MGENLIEKDKSQTERLNLDDGVCLSGATLTPCPIMNREGIVGAAACQYPPVGDGRGLDSLWVH